MNQFYILGGIVLVFIALWAYFEETNPRDPDEPNGPPF